MHISKRIFKNIIKIAKYQTFSKLAVQHPPSPHLPVNHENIYRGLASTFIVCVAVSLFTTDTAHINYVVNRNAYASKNQKRRICQVTMDT